MLACMGMSDPASRGTATVADWLAQPADGRAELIDGELIEKAAPTFEHGRAQVRISTELGETFDRKRGGPGGWWLASEVDVLLDGRGYRPDLAGWRRDRLASPPRERPVTARPDWICEIVSESNRTLDTVVKLRRYHQAGIPHYWIVDQLERTLTVHRHTSEGYLVALRAAADERVRAEPFDAIELHVGVLLGDDIDE